MADGIGFSSGERVNGLGPERKQWPSREQCQTAGWQPAKGQRQWRRPAPARPSVAHQAPFRLHSPVLPAGGTRIPVWASRFKGDGTRAFPADSARASGALASNLPTERRHNARSPALSRTRRRQQPAAGFASPTGRAAAGTTVDLVNTPWRQRLCGHRPNAIAAGASAGRYGRTHPHPLPRNNRIGAVPAGRRPATYQVRRRR